MYIYVPCSGDASRAHDAYMPGSGALTTRPAADIAAVPLLFFKHSTVGRGRHVCVGRPQEARRISPSVSFPEPG